MTTLFSILAPRQDDSIEADGDNKVIVRMQNDDLAGNPDVYGAITAPDVVEPAIDEWVRLIQEGSSPFFSRAVSAAPVPDPEPLPDDPNNKKVFVWAGVYNPPTIEEGNEKTKTFKASHKFPAAGSGSGSSLEIFTAAAQFYRAGQLVPVSVTLKLDSKLTKGTCAKCTDLNKPTVLGHSREPKLAGTWHSPPIAFCGKGSSPGYWVLKKNSSTAWTLVLKQGDKVVVTYTAKTKPKDCSLPIKLQRKGAGSKVCKDWPKTVTVSAAP